jgi:putative DNA primase/helicase
VWTAGRRESCSAANRAEIAREIAKNKEKFAFKQAERWARNAEKNSTLLSQTLAVSDGDPVALYLRRRGLVGPVPECLRFHHALTYWDEGDRGKYPTMVAPLSRSDGEVLALHRTYLTVDGCKAPVPSVKKLTGATGPLSGACIPLHDTQQGVLGIAEGIETAQAAHLASGLPTVAAYCASNLAAYRWPPSVRRIVVFADADPAGAAAANTLRARALREGLSVAVMTPSTHGADWCDVWAQRASVAASQAAT